MPDHSLNVRMAHLAKLQPEYLRELYYINVTSLSRYFFTKTSKTQLLNRVDSFLSNKSIIATSFINPVVYHNYHFKFPFYFKNEINKISGKPTLFVLNILRAPRTREDYSYVIYIEFEYANEYLNSYYNDILTFFEDEIILVNGVNVQ